MKKENLQKKIKKYCNVFLLALQSALEYRMNFLLNLLNGIFLVIVQCSLWTAVFKSSGKEVINGYTYHGMIIYSVIVGVVAKLVSTGFENEIAGEIKNGMFDKYLTQPINYGMFRFSNFIGGKVTQSAFIMSFIILFLIIYKNATLIEISIYRMGVFLLSCVCAMVINFYLFYSVSALAFIITEVWGIFIAFNQGVLLLGGGMFPLDFFGQTIHKILTLLPFKYILYFPVNIICGNMNKSEILCGICMQIIWIGVLLLISKFVWKYGLKKYIAAGG